MLNITCPQDKLYEKVQLVSHGVSGRSTQPIQNNMCLKAAEGALTLVATDLEFISLKSTVPVTIAEEGDLTVPARTLVDISNRLPSGDVSLVGTENNALEISSGRAHFTIRGLPADDFQELPEIEDPVSLELAQSELARILNRTVFATSTDETRPILTGTLFNISGTQLETVATDTYRLALQKTELPVEVEKDQSAIISRRTLQELERILDATSDEPVVINMSDRQVSFELNDVVVACRLIEGQFVNYPKVIPEGGDRIVTAERGALISTLERALVVARDDANRVVIRTSDGTMTVTAESQDIGKAEEELPVKVEGKDAEIAFNAQFLLAMLNAVQAEEISMELSGPLNSGLIRPAEDDSYLYVLMPMQIM
ncbi:MAG: DNA polymerase III subunit beta [Armatimonadota bacterium]